MLEITCIICPIGCRAKATVREGRVLEIEGLECARGKDYVLREIEAPVRDFFTTVRAEGGRIPVLPVRSTRPLPKEKIPACALELAKMVVRAPVREGDVIVRNILGLGVDIIATRDLRQG